MKHKDQKKKDWIIHYVFPTYDGEMDNMINAHTHGFREKYSHPEFQIILPISEKLVFTLINEIGMRAAEGQRFSDGYMIDDILSGYSICLKEVWDDAENLVYRIILPDPNGLFPWDDGCEEVYKKQYKEEV